MKKSTPKRMMDVGTKGKFRSFPRNSKMLHNLDEDAQCAGKSGMRKIHNITNPYDEVEIGNTDTKVLRRFLRKRIGKPWDEVYSEICQVADARSHEGYKLRDHIGFIVALTCHVGENGKIYDEHNCLIGGIFDGKFYVHPTTNTLEYEEPKRYRSNQSNKPKVLELDGKYFYKNKGQWYRVEMEVVESWNNEILYKISARDVFGFASVFWHYNEYSAVSTLKQKYGLSPQGTTWWCKSKQSANSKEISRLKNKYNLS